MAGLRSSLIKIFLFLILFSPTVYGEGLGLYYGKMGGYFKIGTFTEIDLRGPKEAKVTKDSYSSFYRMAKAVKVCIRENELKTYYPEGFVLSEDYLPVMDGTSVVPGSMERTGETTFCYLVKQSNQYFSKDEATTIREESELYFSGYSGINSLPTPVQTKLKKLWARPGTLTEKVERIEKFWEREIDYFVEDNLIYKKYFEFFPEHNFLQAAVALKRGDCFPKNFGLGVSIHQLSEGRVPVRLNYAIWLQNSDEPTKEIGYDRIHLHVEYLAKDKKGRLLWKTAESSLQRNL